MSQWDEINSLLVNRGFKQVSGEAFVSYKGALSVAGDSVSVTINFPDSDFLVNPEVLLNVRPSWVPGVCHHITGSRNSVCYPGKMGDTMDRYSAAGHVEQILRDTASLLQDIKSGNVTADIQDEFASYWSANLLYIDHEEGAAGASLFMADFTNDRGNATLVTTLNQRVNYDAVGLTEPTTWKRVSVTFAELSDAPAIPPNVTWPPENLEQACKWLQQADKGGLRAIRKLLESMYHDTHNRNGLLIFKTPRIWFGVLLILPRTVNRKAYTKKNKFVDAVIYKLASSVKLHRFSLSRIDSTFLVERNLLNPNASLINQRVLLVGCGTIGGFLAENLVRIGAGCGGGLLSIYDPDHVTAGIVGRHRLGLSSLGKEKALVLAAEIKRQFPFANVVGSATSALDSRNFSSFDLVIDATGHQPVSLKLNELYLAKEIKTLVFAWILGNGQAVQTLVCADRKAGCLRCIDASGDSNSLMPISPSDVVTRVGRGCEAPYRPFAVSSSLHAVGLAIDACINLMNGDKRNLLTTLGLDEDIRRVKVKPLKKINRCPACSP